MDKTLKIGLILLLIGVICAAGLLTSYEASTEKETIEDIEWIHMYGDSQVITNNGTFHDVDEFTLNNETLDLFYFHAYLNGITVVLCAVALILIFFAGIIMTVIGYWER